MRDRRKEREEKREGGNRGINEGEVKKDEGKSRKTKKIVERGRKE